VWEDEQAHLDWVGYTLDLEGSAHEEEVVAVPQEAVLKMKLNRCP